MRVSRWRRTTIALVGFAGLAMVGPAAAHNGVGAAFKGTAGCYIVYAYDGYINPSNALEYRLVLLDDHQQPVESGINVAITATPVDQPGGATAVVRATSIDVMANVVIYDLPNPYPGSWTVHVTLAGKLGRGAVSYRMHGAAPTTQTNTPLYTVVHTGPSAATVAGLVGGGAVVVAAVGIAIWRVRRRRRAG
jgi:hypothetical protein